MTVRRPADTHASVLGGIFDSANANANSGSIDLFNYTGLLLVAGLGAITTAPTTANYIAFKVQDSDDGTTFADVTADELKGPEVNGAELVRINSAHAAATHHIGSYVGFKRYVRLQIVFGGTHANAVDYHFSAVGTGRYVPIERDTGQ